MSSQREITYNATEDWLEEIETNIDTLIPTQVRRQGKKTRRPPQLIPHHRDICGKSINTPCAFILSISMGSAPMRRYKET